MTSTQALDGIIAQQSQRLLYIICLFYNQAPSIFWFYVQREHKRRGVDGRAGEKIIEPKLQPRLPDFKNLR